jgi:hypothetical protein
MDEILFGMKVDWECQRNVFQFFKLLDDESKKLGMKLDFTRSSFPFPPSFSAFSSLEEKEGAVPGRQLTVGHGRE